MVNKKKENLQSKLQDAEHELKQLDDELENKKSGLDGEGVLKGDAVG